LKRLGTITVWVFFLAIFATTAVGQADSRANLVQPTLAKPGGTPFYLHAEITERGDPNEHVDIEMSWVAPNKWRRTIKSQEFSQTLIVNGDKVFEQDSDDYFPLGIQVLVMAMVDPSSIVEALRPGDRVLSKANGGADESGKICFPPTFKVCGTSTHGLLETVDAPGRSVDFTDYRKFKGSQVARLLTYHIDPGDSLKARITTLGELNSQDEEPFSIAEPTSVQKQIRDVVLPESELRDLALQPADIIWPQVLEDHQTTGQTSYYVSIDREGQVREVFPLEISVERADDSARRQLMKWKFKPVLRDGAPVQAEAVLSFNFNTRAYGPPSPLTDAEVRKLATHIVDPEFPPGSKTGAVCNIRIAVDADGKVIEQIAGDGSPELTMPCMNAIGKWQFSPILENGQPRPYRAEITFHVP